jgi:glycosyltransferase 2 family protein
MGYYGLTWLVGGISTMCLIQAVEPISWHETLYVAGVGAIGAIVTVLAFFTPSGLGAREGVMYALLLPITSPATALLVVTLSRIVITASELLILAGASGMHVRQTLAASQVEPADLRN